MNWFRWMMFMLLTPTKFSPPDASWAWQVETIAFSVYGCGDWGVMGWTWFHMGPSSYLGWAYSYGSVLWFTGR